MPAVLKRGDCPSAWPRPRLFKPRSDAVQIHTLPSTALSSFLLSESFIPSEPSDVEILVLRAGRRHRWKFIVMQIVASPPSLARAIRIHDGGLLRRREGPAAAAATSTLGAGSDGQRIHQSDLDHDGALTPSDGPGTKVTGEGQGGSIVPAGLPRQAGADVPTSAGQGGRTSRRHPRRTATMCGSTGPPRHHDVSVAQQRRRRSSRLRSLSRVAASSTTLEAALTVVLPAFGPWYPRPSVRRGSR